MSAVRNIAILMAIALAIAVIPGTDRAQGVINAVLSLALATLIAYFVARLYRDRRVEVYGLGDLDRAILYVALGGIVVLLAGAQWFHSTVGGLIEIVLLATCAAGLVRVYQVWRSY